MIDFSKAVEIARNHFGAKGDSELTKIYESDNVWIVYAGKKDQVKYGNMGISIDKITGDISNFVLPSRANFEILKKAKLTEL
ncbi:hypothetical protein AALD01_10075 [Oscillospiraceae bacterium 21-37]